MECLISDRYFHLYPWGVWPRTGIFIFIHVVFDLGQVFLPLSMKCLTSDRYFYLYPWSAWSRKVFLPVYMKCLTSDRYFHLYPWSARPQTSIFTFIHEVLDLGQVFFLGRFWYDCRLARHAFCSLQSRNTFIIIQPTVPAWKEPLQIINNFVSIYYPIKKQSDKNQTSYYRTFNIPRVTWGGLTLRVTCEWTFSLPIATQLEIHRSRLHFMETSICYLFDFYQICALQ